MTKFRITHANNDQTDVEADQYNHANGYFDFTSWEDGEMVQVLSVADKAVVMVKKVE